MAQRVSSFFESSGADSSGATRALKEARASFTPVRNDSGEEFFGERNS